MLKSSWVAAQLAASQEGLSSMKFSQGQLYLFYTASGKKQMNYSATFNRVSSID
jgi:hypothetical protein